MRLCNMSEVLCSKQSQKLAHTSQYAAIDVKDPAVRAGRGINIELMRSKPKKMTTRGTRLRPVRWPAAIGWPTNAVKLEDGKMGLPEEAQICAPCRDGPESECVSHIQAQLHDAHVKAHDVDCSARLADRMDSYAVWKQASTRQDAKHASKQT